MRNSVNGTARPGRMTAVCLLVLSIFPLHAQTALFLRTRCARAVWANDAFFSEGMTPGSGWCFVPELDLTRERWFFSLQLNSARLSLPCPEFNYTFYDHETAASVRWQGNDYRFTATRYNTEVCCGIGAGTRAIYFLTARYETVFACGDQNVRVAHYDPDVNAWVQLPNDDVRFRKKMSHEWFGVGCRFFLPLFFRKYMIEGNIHYFIWGNDGSDVLKFEALARFPMRHRTMFSVGCGVELVTSGTLDGTMWYLSFGIGLPLSTAGNPEIS
ncbi:hypothetical protein JXO52_12215 [bacterium]|nr:hypothetical protein [bacterium]